MILSINYDSQTLPLRYSVSDDENIFDIDSLTLVIGKNGTGKTELLRSVAQEITSPELNEFGSKCEIIFNSLSESEKFEWGCVYYTPVPYQPAFDFRERFENASLTEKNKMIFNGVDTQKKILDDFGIGMNISAIANVNLYPLVMNLISSATGNLSLKTKPGFVFFSKFSFFKEYCQILEDGYEKHQDYKVYYNKRLEIRKGLADEIISWLRGEYDVSQILSFFILINKFAAGDNKTKNRQAFAFFILTFGDELELKGVRKPASHQDFSLKYKLLVELLYSCRHDFKYNFKNDLLINLKSHEVVNKINNEPLKKYFRVRNSSMSSGELAVINQFTSIANKLQALAKKGYRKLLLLIDEGDAFLHLEWQRNYVLQLNKTLRELKETNGIEIIQLIIASHSPLLATDIPKEYVFSLDKEQHPNFTFASPMHMLFIDSFGTETIGEFATQKINEAYLNFSESKQTKKDYNIIKSIDSDVLRKEFYRQFDSQLKAGDDK
jgi:predicted ATPase